MTGFGAGEAPLGDGRTVVELRSLNHRFLDVRVRMPSELLDLSSFMEQVARERLTRGRFDVSVRLEGDALPPLAIDAHRVRAAYRALLDLRDELAPGSELPLAAVLAVPEVLSSAAHYDTSAVQQALRRALELAAGQLSAMRELEGRALTHELRQRLERARGLKAELLQRTRGHVEAYRARLRDRLERLLSEAHVRLDATRLETEVAILADRSDVTEELVRLDSHFAQMEALLGSNEAVGRRLEFLLQEIAREVNTIGGKNQDATLSHLVVELKAEIERMREQVQNVE